MMKHKGTISGTYLGELLVICWKMKQVTEISYMLYALA